MRIFWRTFYAVLILLLSMATWLQFQPDNWLAEKSIYLKHQLTQPKDISVSIGYELMDDNWTSFPVNASTDVIKLISNAVIPVDHNPVLDEKWVYSMEYQLLDDDDNIVMQGDIHHKTWQKIFLDEHTGLHYVAATFYPADQNPVDARLHLINFRGMQRPEKIRIRNKSRQDPVQHVVVRLYQKEHVPEHKLSYLWQRMGEVKRQKLSRASVYQQNLLSDEEKRILLQTEWVPMAPSGTRDKAYKSRKIYIAKDVEEDVVVNLPAVPPEGLLVYPDRFGVVKIPAFPGQVKISWEAVETAKNDDQVLVEWWGHPATRYKKWNADFAQGEISLPLESGVLQLSSTLPVAFRVWIKDRKTPVEITPGNSYVRLYQSAKQPVVYKVNHNANHNTAFRVDIRNYLPGSADAVEFRLIHNDGEVVKTGFLPTQIMRSQHTLVTNDHEQIVSKATSYYFDLPSDIKRLELYTSAHQWVAAYSRPYGLPSIVHYPYKQENATQQQQVIPSWYFVRPSEWKGYVAQGRSVLLSVQPEPPDIDPMLLEGRFRWDQFMPEGNWRGRELLLENDSNIPVKKDALSSRYIELTGKTKNVLTFDSYDGEISIKPQLLYIQQEQGDLHIQLKIDGKDYFNDTVYARDGEIDLPVISPGKHVIEILGSSSARLFINHVTDDASVYLKRLAMQLNQETVHFNHVKEFDEELLALRVYVNQDKNQPQKIQLKINDVNKKGIGPFTSWTYTHKTIYLEAGDGADAHVLQTANRNLAPSRLFFISLGDDLENNRHYPISIQLKQGPEGYLVVTRTVPGQFDTRAVKQLETISN